MEHGSRLGQREARDLIRLLRSRIASPSQPLPPPSLAPRRSSCSDASSKPSAVSGRPLPLPALSTVLLAGLLHPLCSQRGAPSQSHTQLCETLTCLSHVTSAALCAPTWSSWRLLAHSPSLCTCVPREPSAGAALSHAHRVPLSLCFPVPPASPPTRVASLSPTTVGLPPRACSSALGGCSQRLAVTH